MVKVEQCDVTHDVRHAAGGGDLLVVQADGVDDRLDGGVVAGPELLGSDGEETL